MRRQYLIYATEEGGLFKFGYPERFDDAVKTGKLDVTPADRDGAPQEYVKPVYMALLSVDRDFDFILGSPRVEHEVLEESPV